MGENCLEGRDKHSKIMELAVKRGIIWQSYEIYGGVAGFYDIGPIGSIIKRKIIELWRRTFIQKHQEVMVEIETPVIGPSKVYEASGHVSHFTDPIVECLKCGRKFRADHLIKEKLGINVEGLPPNELTRIIREHNLRCPVCGGPLSEVKTFNLLFRTYIGPYSSNIGYLRPEAAQGMFVSFKRVYEAMRKKLPLGIAQIGRVARNEISPRQGIIRLREFTIAEFEFFFDPDNPNEGGYLEKYLQRIENKIIRITRNGNPEEPEVYKIGEAIEEGVISTPWLGYWMAVAQEFIESLGVNSENIVFEDKPPHERAHYSSQTFDQLVKVSKWGWIEVSGHSYRTDYDLSRHMKYSGKDLTVFRAYEKPLIRKTKKVVVDRAWVGRTYRSEAPRILKELEEQLSKIDINQLEDLMRREKEIRIGKYMVPTSALKIIEKEEKISGRRFVPHVVEPSFGVERLLYIVLEYAFKEKSGRNILSIPRYLAPYDAAVFPLTREKKLLEVARNIWKRLVDMGFYVVYDDDGSIGRRYARVDEIGVPIAITVDYQTLEDNTVTVRDRDTWTQVRISIEEIPVVVRKTIENNINVEDAVALVRRYMG